MVVLELEVPMFPLTQALILTTLVGQVASNSPFEPPKASLHYAPDRAFHLVNVKVDLDVDYPNRAIKGRVDNTIVILRSRTSQLNLMAAEAVEISSIKVDGNLARFQRNQDNLTVEVPLAPKGRLMHLVIDYSVNHSRARSFGSGAGGFHWIEPSATTPDHVGFWTQGETNGNRGWAPTWDYPNDMTTSETRTTVPADWTVIGNGVLRSNKLSPDRKRRTFDWRMDQPHATYLLSLVAGPLDTKKDKWRDVDLWYVVPKGLGAYIDDTFAGTKDMLSFYSDTLGVKYPWPKYAQDGMYDFGGGMENVSATTFGQGSITEAKSGFRTADSLLSHELGHQWFGDLVTCKDWGDTWLNESFATFMQMIYFEHSRGKNAYDREVDHAINAYLQESRRYQRPISTKMYQSPDNMFDSHTYPKGGVVLHTLRRWLGDEAFFDALHDYLTVHRHQPVESAQLRRAFTEATGINCEPFWAQWIEKPGHPVLDSTWSYDESNKQILVKVSQVQDTSKGAPTYKIPASFGIFEAGADVMEKAPHIISQELDGASQEIRINWPQRPSAVILDPKHEFLKEIPNLHWTHDELRVILKSAPNCVDRTRALKELLANSPSPEDVRFAAAIVADDLDQFPVFENLSALSILKQESLRPLWLGQLKSRSIPRQAEAVTALAELNPEPTTTSTITALVSAASPTPVVTAAIRALVKLQGKACRDTLKKAQGLPSLRDQIKNAADVAMAEVGS